MAEKAISSMEASHGTDTVVPADATAYESYIEYPTYVKLIWNSCHELHLLINDTRKKLKLRKSRNKYEKRKKFFLSYQKKRKKPRRQEKKVRKKLLKYLRRLLELWDELQKKYSPSLSRQKKRRLQTIKEIYKQQHEFAYGNAKSIEQQIVSIDKPYIRPIVRGKEVKAVEFGAKVNKLQVNGISMIEHLSFDAFHEGNRPAERRAAASGIIWRVQTTFG